MAEHSIKICPNITVMVHLGIYKSITCISTMSVYKVPWTRSVFLSSFSKLYVVKMQTKTQQQQKETEKLLRDYFFGKLHLVWLCLQAHLSLYILR